MRSTKSRVSAAFAAILAVAGIAAAAWAFHGVRGRPASSAGCAGRHGLGSVAYLRAGELRVADLARCTDKVLVRSASAPVRWSPDGRYVAFGRGAVVRVRGGSILHPFGRAVRTWSWSPAGDRIAGVTPGGGVLLAAPRERPRRLLPDGWGAGALAFDPTGRMLAVDRRIQSGMRFRRQELDVLHLSTGRTRTAYRPAAGTTAPPEVAGWSPDGRWILFWSDTLGSGSLASDGLPLDAVPVDGGGAVRVVGSMLPYPDFLGSCGGGMAIAAGPDRYVTSGKYVVAVSSPGGGVRRLASGERRSWFWPDCSTDGSRVAVTSTRSTHERRFDAADRSIWLVADGRASRLIGREGDGVSEEFPRWSADGRFLLFVRHATRSESPARLVLARVRGRTAHVLGTVARLSPQLGYFGHDGWAAVSDWYR